MNCKGKKSDFENDCSKVEKRHIPALPDRQFFFLPPQRVMIPCPSITINLIQEPLPSNSAVLKYEQPNQLMTPLLSQVKSFKVPFQIPSTTPATAMCLPLSTAHLPLSRIRPHFWNHSCYFYQLSGLLVECQPWDWDIVGLIPKRVITKTIKWYPLCPCLTFST